MRPPTVAFATVALLAVMASASPARADEPTSTESKESDQPNAPRGPVEGRDAFQLTGSALLIGGGLALLPAAYVGGTVAVGALEPGGAERAAKDFQEPYVFVPLAAGFAAVMVGAALLVIVNPPTETPSKTRPSKQSAWATPFTIRF